MRAQNQRFAALPARPIVTIAYGRCSKIKQEEKVLKAKFRLAAVLLALLMFSGRVGAFSLLSAIAEKRENPPVKRPDGKIFIG